MKERIFNLFYFVQAEIIKELGVVVHGVDGSDSEKLAFLRDAVNDDYRMCDRSAVPLKFCDSLENNRFKFSSYMALSRLGRHLEVFEDIFCRYNAATAPLCCVTAIIDGYPAIDITTNHDPFLLTKHQGHPKVGSGVMADYLEKYMKATGFDMPGLIHDDYFGAIKLLFNKGYYVSCMKLLASFIDTIAFLEYGDIRENFIKWLDDYSEIGKLGINSSQLWELRNSILHMSNLDSRKVLSGEQKRISFCVATKGYTPSEDLDTQYFNLYDFITVLADALSRWVNSFNQNPDKFPTFVERYDRIISDDRHAIKHV